MARRGFEASNDEERVSASASSTARRQMSRARRASPDTAATFLLANWIASGSTMLSGTCSSRERMISWSCSWV